jgi:hypothetical protein
VHQRLTDLPQTAVANAPVGCLKLTTTSRCAVNRPWECCWASSSCFRRPDLQRPMPARRIRTANIVVVTSAGLDGDSVRMDTVYFTPADLKRAARNVTATRVCWGVLIHRSATLEHSVQMEKTQGETRPVNSVLLESSRQQLGRPSAPAAAPASSLLKPGLGLATTARQASTKQLQAPPFATSARLESTTP